MSKIRSVTPRRKFDHRFDASGDMDQRRAWAYNYTSADKQFDYDDSLLQQGRYREWFYEGLQESQLDYLRQPARNLAERKCYICKEYKPLIEYTKNEWNIPDRFRCNTCVLTSNGRNGHRYIDALPAKWPEKAACVRADPEVFFPNTTAEYRHPNAEWRKYCPECPVKELCLKSAEQTGDRPYGIFGGVYFDSHGRQKKDV
jgi:Transcription factor WhiB/Stc1 domain